MYLLLPASKVNNAAAGLVTSLFLQSLNSILKAYANALQLIMTGLFAWLIFAVPLNVATLVSMGVVLAAVALYSANPVISPTSSKKMININLKQASARSSASVV